MNEPSDIAQEALDAALLDIVVSDIEQGTRPAQMLARKYRPCLASLLRAAHWRFARRQAAMTCLADASGVLSPVTTVIQPWLLEYAIPNDFVNAIMVPFNPPTNTPVPQGNFAIPQTVPLLGGGQPTPAASLLPGIGLIPSRFLIARDVNFPPAAGTAWWEVQGQSPGGQTVVLSNVPNAQIVYTSLVIYPSEWDSAFREAMIAYLASEICGLHQDKRIAMQVRRDQMAIAKERINLARVADCNDGWNNNDHIAEWTRARMVGRAGLAWNGMGGWGSGWGGADGPGYFWGGYGSFTDGAAF